VTEGSVTRQTADTLGMRIGRGQNLDFARHLALDENDVVKPGYASLRIGWRAD